MKREQILLLASVLVLALLGWGVAGGGVETRQVRPRDRVLELPELGPLDPVVALRAADGTRDPFCEPREVEPLPPLELPPPPLAELAALLPPPLPDAGPDHWSHHLLLVPAVLPGGLDELIDVDAGGAEDGAEADPGFDAVAGSPGQDGDYAAHYDQVRLGPGTVLWGRILNENRYELQAGRDPLRFQEVNPRSGEDRFGVQAIPPDRYEGFELAHTLRNEIELGVRALDRSAGAIRERLEYVRWLLDQGLLEPAAFAHAERLAREAVALAPNDIATWMSLGECWEATFRFDEAFALYARLSGQPLAGTAPELGVQVEEGAFRRRSAPFVRMGHLLERFGLLEQATAEYRAAAALADGDPAAALALGQALTAAGRAAEVAPLLERSLSLYVSRNSSAALRHGCALGEARLRAGDFDGALAAFRDVQRAGGGSAGALEGRCGEVAAHYLSGRFDEAYRACEEGIATFGSDWRLLYLRGIAGGALAAPAAEVIRDLRAAAAAAPFDAAPALAAEAFWLDVIGQPELARARLAEALELAPELPYALYLRGRWGRLDGDLEGARQDLRAVIRGSARCAAALGELGWLLHNEGRYAVADVALRRAGTEEPEWAEAALRRGLNQLAAGRPAEARLSLASAQGAGFDAEVRNALAWAAYLEGDVDGAIAEYALLIDALSGREDDPQLAHASLWQERITAHARLVRWLDRFDGSIPRPEWDVQSEARNGVEPVVAAGALRIQGRHPKPAESVTRAFRSVRALDFRSLAATFVVGAEQRGEGGIMLSLENRSGQPTWEFRVYRGPEGRLRWLTRKQQGEPERGEGTRLVEPGEPVAVSFALDREANPPVLTVRAGAEVLFAGPAPLLHSPSGDLRISVFARTLNALPVDVALDDVELVFALPQP